MAISSTRPISRAVLRGQTPLIVTAGGVIAALLALELVCRVFVAAPLPSKASITADSPQAPVFEVRQLWEGIATSHFTTASARLTGNQFLSNGHVGLIFGDSFVEALQVEDSQTMGSVMERLARTRNVPLNVRQYGFSGGSPSDYILDAESARRLWNPAWVVVFVTANDFQSETVRGRYSRLIVEGDGTARVVALPQRQQGLLVSFLRRSALLFLLNTRLNLILQKPDSSFGDHFVDQATTAITAWGSVLLLKEAFEDRLAIVYKPYVPSFGTAAIEPEEVAVLNACEGIVVRCLSLRETLLNARAAGSVMINGFANTGLEEGHMNSAVHRIVGTAIHEQLREWKLER